MPQQITRLLLVAVVLTGLFIAVRHFLVPASFGKYGHYRADSINEIKALPPNYAGGEACATCHEDIAKEKAGARHAGIACETCHGPALKHAEDPSSFKPDKPRGRAFCGMCHSKNAGRPKSIPQIDIETHNEGMDCYLCHKAHDPRIK